MMDLKEFVLEENQTGYDVVGDYVRDYWKKTSYATAIVLLETSYDGKEYSNNNEVVSPFSNPYDIDSMEFLHDWWEGEKYIRIRGIMNICDIDCFEESEEE